jgi:hypothetical protein
MAIECRSKNRSATGRTLEETGENSLIFGLDRVRIEERLVHGREDPPVIAIAVATPTAAPTPVTATTTAGNDNGIANHPLATATARLLDEADGTVRSTEVNDV